MFFLSFNQSVECRTSDGFLIQVSKLGFGCAGLSINYYNNLVNEEAGIAIIKDAFSKGVTFFDTSDVYGGNHANEFLVGKVCLQLISY